MSSKYIEGFFKGGNSRSMGSYDSGDRCAAITGYNECGLCHARQPGERTVDEGCISQGHPTWYCTKFKPSGTIVCLKPEFVKRRAQIIWLWHGLIMLTVSALIAALVVY